MEQRIKDIQALAETKGLDLCGYEEKFVTEDEVRIKKFTIEFKEAKK
jgi:hypothetical protein